jgi:hypothetical protein
MQWSFSLQSWKCCLTCCSVVVSSKGRHKVEQNLSAFSQAVWAPVTGGLGTLLVSPFNMKWRCSAPAGGVEGSKFCLFSVVLPARCVSSVSPRFHYRRHAFCFLPVAATLESQFSNLLRSATSRTWKCLTGRMLVVHTCNPSNLGGRDQKDLGSKPAWTNSSLDPISKNLSQK